MEEVTMIERVARAICNAHRTWPGRSDDKQREIVNQAWRSHEPEARAAIDAMHGERDAVLEEAAKETERYQTGLIKEQHWVAAGIAEAIRALKAEGLAPVSPKGRKARSTS